MLNGAPCKAPGAHTVGNLTLPLPFGIAYNSMFSSRANPSGTRPSGFFGPGMTFPFGYIEVVGEIRYRVSPDGTETAFTRVNDSYKSENEQLGDLTFIRCRTHSSCVETQPSGVSIEFASQGNGSRLYPTIVKDLYGHQLYNIAYGSNGALFTITDPQALQTKFIASRTHSSQVGQITDPTGASATIAYDSQGRMSRFQYDGVTLSLVYDTNGNLTSSSQQAGTETLSWYYSYQGGVLTDTIDSKYNSMVFSYSANIVTAISGVAGTPQGFAMTTYQTANSRQIPVKYEVGKGAPSTATAVVWSSTLNSSGLLKTTTDQLGQTTSYTYDSGPFPTTVNLPDGTVKSITYDAVNLYRPTQIVSTGPDRKEITESLTWSGAKLTARSVTSDGAVVLNESYGSSSSSQTVTRTTTNNYTYDGSQNLVGSNGPGGRFARTLGDGGTQTTSVNGVAFTTSSTIDPSGSTSTVVSSGAGISTVSTLAENSVTVSSGTSDGRVVLTVSNSSSGTTQNSTSTFVSGGLTTTRVSNSTTTDSGSGTITTSGTTTRN